MHGLDCALPFRISSVAAMKREENSIRGGGECVS
jgi:hypothetical protein